MIHTFIAYQAGNLGAAYNAEMQLVPDGHWACFLDHDAMFGTYEWHAQLEAGAESGYGLMFAVTNRVACRWQRDRLFYAEDSLVKLRERAMFSSEMYGNQVEDITHKTEADDLPGGVLMLTSKNVWQAVGGFKNGILGVDNDYFRKVRDAGFRIGLLKGLYVIHWYRGGDRANKAHLLHGGSRAV